jgi:hypothetical protein
VAVAVAVAVVVVNEICYPLNIIRVIK